MIDNLWIEPSDIRKVNAQVGLVTSVKDKKRLIFNLLVKGTDDSKRFVKNLESAVLTLREAVETMSLKTFSVSRRGNWLDSIP